MIDRRTEQLFRALEKFPQRVEITPAADLLLDSRRANPKHPASIELAVPDEVVKDLRGSPDRGDLLFLPSPADLPDSSPLHPFYSAARDLCAGGTRRARRAAHLRQARRTLESFLNSATARFSASARLAVP